MKLCGPGMSLLLAIECGKSESHIERHTKAERASEEAHKTRERNVIAQDMVGPGGNVLMQVPWDSELIQALLDPVDDDATQACKFQGKVLQPRARKPWMTVGDYIEVI